jgi:protein-disulfide isomerase
VRAGPNRRQLTIVAAFAVIAVVAVIFIANSQNAASPPPTASGIRVSANVMGQSNAPVTIEEWADLQCPACRQFAVGTEPQLRTAYIATGKVRFVFHHLAFIGQESIWAGEAVECAGEQNRFWDLHDRLYAVQGGENSGTFSKANLEKIAGDIGLGAGFNACLESDRYLQRVTDDTKAGQAKGVNATPTLFVNGRKLADVSIDGLRAAIDPLIK